MCANSCIHKHVASIPMQITSSPYHMTKLITYLIHPYETHDIVIRVICYYGKKIVKLVWNVGILV